MTPSPDAGARRVDVSPAPPDAAVPGRAVRTVFLIVMENHSWSSIKGSSSAPYINGTLLRMASSASRYYNPPGLHPSLPNYLWLEGGQSFGVSDDSDPVVNHQSTHAHLARQLDDAGITWRSYQEDTTGSVCPVTGVQNYAPKHNPFVYFDDLTGTNDASNAFCIAHNRPFSELPGDLGRDAVARYNFITPDLCHDMHDACSPTNDAIRQGDDWLAGVVPAILGSAAYRDGGALFIAWDEAGSGDGPIGLLLISDAAKGGGYTSDIPYTHSSLVRTLQEIFDVRPFLGDAANATDLSDLFASFP